MKELIDLIALPLSLFSSFMYHDNDMIDLGILFFILLV